MVSSIVVFNHRLHSGTCVYCIYDFVNKRMVMNVILGSVGVVFVYMYQKCVCLN